MTDLTIERVAMNDMIDYVISNGYPIFYSIEDIDSDIEYVKLAKDVNDFLGDRSLIKLKMEESFMTVSVFLNNFIKVLVIALIFGNIFGFISISYWFIFSLLILNFGSQIVFAISKLTSALMSGEIYAIKEMGTGLSVIAFKTNDGKYYYIKGTGRDFHLIETTLKDIEVMKEPYSDIYRVIDDIKE